MDRLPTRSAGPEETHGVADCHECAKPVSQQDYDWDGRLYHLHCLPVMEMAQAVEAAEMTPWKADKGRVKEAVRAFGDLAVAGAKVLAGPSGAIRVAGVGR